MKRIFIAVDIADAARGAAAAYAADLRARFPAARVGWERPEKLHLTLKFVGAASDAQLARVAEVAAAAAPAEPAFAVALDGTGVFPNARRPRVLWLGVRDAAGGLARLNARLENECARLGHAAERRAYAPHLTLGRVRAPDGAAALAAAHLGTDFGPRAFRVPEIVVYESRLAPAGSLYAPLAKFALG